VPLYNPAHFRNDDPAALASIVDRIVFGTLLSTGAGGLSVSHAPFLMNRSAGAHGSLEAHLARANPHVKELDGTEVLVLFQGPAYYVSPSWYVSKQETGRVVPTWNYVVVHARGVARTFHDPSRLKERVAALTNRLESSRDVPWRVDDAPADFIDDLARHIVGVDIELTALEGKLKLGQNRPAVDRTSLAAGLQAERPDIARALRVLFGDAD
jgi:transcriptional regulator